jgi:hypothetical protein
MSKTKLLPAEFQAASQIASFLKGRAADLPPSSPVGELAERSAGHWETIANNGKARHLALVELKESGVTG